MFEDAALPISVIESAFLRSVASARDLTDDEAEMIRELRRAQVAELSVDEIGWVAEQRGPMSAVFRQAIELRERIADDDAKHFKGLTARRQAEVEFHIMKSGRPDLFGE